MTLTHAYRLYTSYGQNQVDISAILMMQLFNYIGMAYKYISLTNAKKNLKEAKLYNLSRLCELFTCMHGWSKLLIQRF